MLRTAQELALADWRRFSEISIPRVEIGLGGWGYGNANRHVAALLGKLDGGSATGSEQAYIEAMQREFPSDQQREPCSWPWREHS